MKFLKTKRSFKKEFKRQIRLAIIAAIGFTIAFAWRNAIYNSVNKIIEQISKSTQMVTNEILTAMAITVLAVLVIFFTSKLLKAK